MLPHNKIIKTTAKKFLEPEGLFQIGSSKTWLDDCGYYAIIVNFESGHYTKSASLAAGVTFLWESTKRLSETLTYNIDSHATGFVEYKNDDAAFQTGIERLARKALELVHEYRRFSDMDYAKSYLQQEIDKLPEHRQFWEWYHLAMLCFLKDDYEEGIAAFDHYLKRLKDSFYAGDCYIEWHEEFYNYCVETIQCRLTSQESARQMVIDMINRRRSAFCAKPSYKKMRKEYWHL